MPMIYIKKTQIEELHMKTMSVIKSNTLDEIKDQTLEKKILMNLKNRNSTKQSKEIKKDVKK